MNYLFIDTEYSSFFSADRAKSGELLQIAVVPVINGVRDEVLCEFMAPLTKVWNVGAEKVHGISRERAESFQHPKDACYSLGDFLARHDCVFQVVGHNPSGDKKYIERLFNDYGLGNNWFPRIRPDWLCTASIAKKNKSLVPVKNHKLETLCKFFKIDINAHDALSDAMATAELFEKLSGLFSVNKQREASLVDLTEVEKSVKYNDRKYVMLNGDGCVYISEHATKNPDALRVVLDSIWKTYGEIC